ncbi:MAG: diguanylate cyclase [Gammaproteobacteria bacterium]|nr:diguanylate cyclase [Gammaproteobacteria bacterium]
MNQVDKDNLDPQQRWKTRYYEALGELENKEKAWREIERLLRHLITRLTLAADVNHPPLSQSLADLRNEVRDGKDFLKLRTLIETISVQVGELDQVRTNRLSLKSPARILQMLLKQLTIPEGLARKYKDIDKQIHGMDEFSEVNGMIDQVGELLKQIIATPAAPIPNQTTEPTSVTVEHREARRLKLLERIFAKRNDAPVVAPTITFTEELGGAGEINKATAEAATTTNPNTDSELTFSDSPKTIAPAVGDLLLQLAMRLPEAARRRINFRALKSHANKARKRKDLLPIVDVIAQNIAVAYQAAETTASLSFDSNAAGLMTETIKSILNQLNPPSDLQLRVSEIEKLLSEPAAQPGGIVHVLNALAEVVAEISKRLSVQQQDLAGFFHQLSQRLQDLEQGLQSSAKLREANHDQIITMEQEVRGEIKDIRSAVQNMLDLEKLKLSVDMRLDGLDTRLRVFRQNEDQRYHNAQALVQQLTSKVQTLEQDSAQLRQRLEQTQQQAVVDTLTGLPNRKAYEERVMAEIARCRRYAIPLTMVVWDVDNFKSVNDTYGHAAGDRVLKVIGEVLVQHIRETDFVARYGGEEFVLLLLQTPLAAAQAVCDKLRERIAATPFHFQDRPVTITLSGGLAEYQQGEDLSSLFERADKAMYAAKQAGRNRLQVATLSP